MDDGDPTPRRILVIMAHPDDVDYGAAGTVARWTAEGHLVTYCVVTDGDAGSDDPDVDRSWLATTRRAEQRTAAEIVGVREVGFLGYRDGCVEPGLGLRRDLARAIRGARPHLVLTHSPDRDLVHVKASHPDHRAVGSAVLDAVYPDARNPCAFPELIRDEGLAAWTVPEVWVRGGPAIDHHVDVTDTFPLKMAAIRAHRSQGGQSDDFETTMRTRLAALARTAGLPEGRLAETYLRIDTA
ncbi:PIG-L deacetylase family protein [Actinacidiphila alni]|uniref:PIG-L deacetylase family protein n=1 Tax=Actinacidiphila alni TaxID=380248 RepID=UPI0033E3FEFE